MRQSDIRPTARSWTRITLFSVIYWPVTSRQPSRAIFFGGGVTWPRNRRNEPYSRHAFCLDARTLQFLPANPATEYLPRSVQLISAFGISPSVRISHRTAELGRLGIRTVEASRSWRGIQRWPKVQLKTRLICVSMERFKAARSAHWPVRGSPLAGQFSRTTARQRRGGS